MSRLFEFISDRMYQIYMFYLMNLSIIEHLDLRQKKTFFCRNDWKATTIDNYLSKLEFRLFCLIRSELDVTLELFGMIFWERTALLVSNFFLEWDKDPLTPLTEKRTRRLAKSFLGYGFQTRTHIASQTLSYIWNWTLSRWHFWRGIWSIQVSKVWIMSEVWIQLIGLAKRIWMSNCWIWWNVLDFNVSWSTVSIPNCSSHASKK